MKKPRYVSDGKIYFVKVTVILHNGKEITAIDDTALDDIDANWYTYYNRALEKFGGKMQSFQVVQLSKHDPEVKRYIRDNNIHLPNERRVIDGPSHFQELEISDEEVNREVERVAKFGKPADHNPRKNPILELKVMREGK